MSFVIDASVTACWAFQDEDHPVADRSLLRIRREEALAPTLWWFELRNILIVNERRKRLTEPDTAKFLSDLSRLAIQIDRDPDESSVLGLARRHRLSAYDAAYLELASRKALPLATLDEALAKAAKADGVSLI